MSLDIASLYELCAEYLRITADLAKATSLHDQVRLEVEKESVSLAIHRLIDNKKGNTHG